MIRTSDRLTAPAARFGVMGLAAILVLGGCSSPGGEPNAEAVENNFASSSSGESPDLKSAIPSETPTHTAAAYRPATAEGPAQNVPLPVIPELAKEESKEGLIAFGQHWFGLVNYGYETGDAAPVRDISAPDCEICASFYQDLDEGYVNDDWIEGGELTIRSSGTAFVKTPDGRYQLLLSVIQDSGANRGPNGKVYGELPGDEASTAQIMEATYVSDHWIVNLVENM